MKKSTDRNRKIEQYVSLRKKYTLIFLVAYWIIIGLPYLIVMLTEIINKDTSFDFIPIFLPILILIAGFPLLIFYASYHGALDFRKSIAMQEKIFSITFSDTNSMWISEGVYLSDEWIISCDSALYFAYISEVTYSRRIVDPRKSSTRKIGFFEKSYEVCDVHFTTLDKEVFYIDGLKKDAFAEMKRWLSEKCHLVPLEVLPC